MELSVEAKVAAAVAAAFMALTPGAMAQGRGKGGSSHYGPTNNPGVNTRMSQQGYNSSQFGRANAENKQKFSDENAASSIREQREERHEAREQRKERHEAREQREERHDAREQRYDRQQAHRQRAQRYQKENTKDKSPSVKSPFDGSILEVKSADAKQ